MGTRGSQGRTRVFATLSAAAAVFIGCVSPANAAQTTYSGRAYAAFVNTSLTGPIYISDTGNLLAQGGHKNAGLLDVSVPGTLSATVASASTSGGGGAANSRASLADVVLTVGGNTISASFLQARTHATCSGVSGSSEIVDLNVNGQQITVGAAPNQSVPLPLGSLIINEQMPAESRSHHEITVNAIHVVVPGVAEVILSGAHSDIDCKPSTAKGPCHDFVNAGGWIITPTGGKGTFGLHAGLKEGSTVPSGHLNYIDHSAGLKVHGVSVAAYSADGTCRTFSGTCTINGAAGTFTVTVCDNGEPGRADTFQISLSNGYSAGGLLDGGNVQLHAPCAGRP